MKLYFMRHGIASRSEWSGVDELRPLTERGREAVQKEAAQLQKLGVVFDAIITSPLTRAQQTAQIVAEVYGLEDELIEEERLSPGFNEEDLKEILQNRADADNILFVGHEPDLSMVIGHIIGNGWVIMKKGSIACIELTQSQPYYKGELLWLATPMLLGVKK